MNKTKRVLSVVLAVLMLSSLIAALAIADNETCNVEIKYVFASDQNKQAAHSWTAKVGRGSTLNVSVTSPTVVGYHPDQTTVTINETISDDKTIEVLYYASEVAVIVNHYRQNIDNDGYTLFETENGTGFTDSTVGDRAKQHEGFIALPYDKDELVAADGTTSVEIYYDRNYYLLSLNLDGGYGVEPIYAKYGTPISLGEPTKAGYTFKGWKPAAPATMPANGAALTAQWEADKTAKVSVVVWGENADDEDYSYIQSVEMTGTVGENFTITENGKLICTKEEHTHSSTVCGINCIHSTHDLTCYGLNANAQSVTPDSEATKYFAQLQGGVSDGYIYYFDDNGTSGKGDLYYLRLNGKYYKYNGKPTANIGNQIGSRVSCSGEGILHSTDYFYKYELKTTCTHTHTDSCYACGKTEHTHGSDCYFKGFGLDSNLWDYKESDTVKVAADGSTVVNVYYDRTEFTLTFVDGSNTVKTITEKWGADIHDEFPIKDGEKTIWWNVPSGCKSFKPGTQLGSIDTMPGENIRFTKYDSEFGATIYYYVETLDGENGTYTHDGKNFKLYKEIAISKSGYLTYKEEFHDIIGFRQYWSDPKFSSFNQDGKTSEIKDKNYLCYIRNSYDLVFISNNTEVKTSKVKFEAALGTSDGENFVPAYPSNFEPNAFKFAGWYQDPEGVKPVDWNAKMPAASVTVYAKWVPVQHKVKTWLTDKMETPVNVGDTGSNEQTVAHRATAVAPAEPTHEPYAFIGWFYMDGNVEKAFDFSMPVVKDLNLYAKWSSNVMVEYTIKYMLKDANGNETTTEVAAPTTGNALDGVNKTFEAKAGEELYAGYRTGYLPETNSHAMTISVDAEDKNEYIFWYVAKAKVAYTVRYLDTATGAPVVVDGKPTPDKHDETSAAIITERFLQIDGYAPDAFQKRLILSATESENVIIFWYTKDNEHAPVHVIHWTQNIANDDYTEYQSSTDLNGVIGNPYTENPLTIPGFTYNENMSKASGTLTKDGLILNLYYDRNTYPYEFRFVDRDGNPIEGVETVTGRARYQAQVTERAKNLENAGWMLDTTRCSENGAINIVIENQLDKNVYTFYYLPFYNIVHVKSGVAGEKIKTVIPNNNKDGLTDKVSPGYLYGGAFDDEKCETVHDFGQENAINFTPVKGKTYCIWEVNDEYLRPSAYSTTRHDPTHEGNWNVVGLYLITTVDREKYQSVGFDIIDTNMLQANSAVYSKVEVRYNSAEGELYETLYTGTEHRLASVKGSGGISDKGIGYVAISESQTQVLQTANTSITYRPYWITLDGIRVTSAYGARTCTYLGADNKSLNVTAPTKSESSCTIAANASESTVLVQDTYLLSKPVDEATETPDVPVTPDVPETPVVPEVPEAPAMTLTGEAMFLRAQFTYDMMTNTAKFISAIDVNACTEYGFVINGENIRCEEAAETVDGYSAAYLFGESVNGAMLMSCNVLLDGFADGITINVTPYCIDLNGNVVYGETRTLVYRQWMGLEG